MGAVEIDDIDDIICKMEAASSAGVTLPIRRASTLFCPESCNDFFDDIMAELSASKAFAGDQMPHMDSLQMDLESPSNAEPGVGRSCVDHHYRPTRGRTWRQASPKRHKRSPSSRRSSATHVRRPLHSRPFGPALTPGGSFGMPGTLRHRDLTPWEQERAVAPERSWGISSMDCVKPHYGHSVRDDSPTRLLQMASTQRPPSSSQASKKNLSVGQPGGHLRQCQELRRQRDSDEILTPVEAKPTARTLLPSNHGGWSTAPFTSNRKLQDAVRTPAPNQETLRHSESATTIGEVQKLIDRRRRLAAELKGTDGLLQDALNNIHSAAEESGHHRLGPGGGGGARPRSRPAPSAGGPFAGPRGMHHRSLAAHSFRTTAQAAADAYQCLGPRSNGPPQQEIHPLWS
eukprot:TRINITY_DN6526_c0_g2_i3.p1 TRINITY_DN6526_c0_g2~~TRINITY_DN6526_c0_g2_i3.p1  ORF type:complete len:411 (+),score=31.25 TRINITY_DN6526_c0_g2_i3:30-1235(+)